MPSTAAYKPRRSKTRSRQIPLRTARQLLEDRASWAWTDLSEALTADTVPSLAWAVEWMPDGTLETLWQATSDWYCYLIAMKLCEYSVIDDVDRRVLLCRCPSCATELFFRRHLRQVFRRPVDQRPHSGEYLRRAFPAPTLQFLRKHRVALARVFDLPF